MIRFLVGLALAGIAVLNSAWAQPQSPARADYAIFPPACAVPSGGSPVPSYVDESVKQLRDAVPQLHGARFLTNPQASAGTAPAQDETTSILLQTSKVIAATFQTIPNLVAKERVERTLTSSASNSQMAPDIWPNGRSHMLGRPSTSTTDSVFTYQIISRQDSASRLILDEYRTDAHNRPVPDASDDSNSSYGVGFSGLWLIFFPGNLLNSRFRYLGQQKIDQHETYVVAFAEIPEKAHMRTTVGPTSARCSTAIQGIAWIDRSTFQIVRMQSDLLSPIPSINLRQLRSILNYHEVKIPGRNLSLWLPIKIEIAWQMANQNGEELHRYSNYRLFASTVTILPSEESSSH